jgi:hypothetical protein
MISNLLLKTKYIRYPIFKLLFIMGGQKNNSINRYKYKYKGKSILIVGNGPSIKETPLNKFNIPSIGMNKINHLFDKTLWRPSFIICNNGLVMMQNKKFFQKTKIPVLLDFKALFMQIRSRNISYFLTHFNNKFSDQFDTHVGVSGTVTYSALQFAYFLGVKRIIIVGVDHNFKGFDNIKTKSKMEIFRDKDENHFDPDYFKNQKWGLPDLFSSEIGFRKALNFFNENDIEIFDATINGKLMIFPKITIDEAILLANQ